MKPKIKISVKQCSVYATPTPPNFLSYTLSLQCLLYKTFLADGQTDMQAAREVHQTSALRRGPSCLARLRTRITSRCPATVSVQCWPSFFFFFFPLWFLFLLLHPSSTTCTAAVLLAVACVFTNYQLCILSPEMRPAEGKSPAGYEFTCSASYNNYIVVITFFKEFF